MLGSITNSLRNTYSRESNEEQQQQQHLTDRFIIHNHQEQVLGIPIPVSHSSHADDIEDDDEYDEESSSSSSSTNSVYDYSDPVTLKELNRRIRLSSINSHYRTDSLDLKNSNYNNNNFSWKSLGKFFNLKTLMILILALLLMIILFLNMKLSNLTDLNDQLNSNIYYENDNPEWLTKDVNIIPIHSHNDEWRKLPFFNALKYGSNSIEADCWIFDEDPNTILVGHNTVYLSKDKNIDNMYLNHLFNLLENVNQRPDLSKGDNDDTTDNSTSELEKFKKGIFYNSPETTTYFYIDVKNNNVELLKSLEKKLQKFLDANYLTTYNKTTNEFKQGPLTVVITGEYPLEYISSKELVYTFIDAPLHKLFSKDEDFEILYPANQISIFASASLFQLTGYHKALNYFQGLSKSQIKDLERFITKAHELNLKVRIWETPAWPISIRNKVWKQLIKLDVDYLNVDDLKSASRFF